MIIQFMIFLMLQTCRTQRVLECGMHVVSRKPRDSESNGLEDSSTRNAKIMFGTPATPGTYSWTVSLELLHPEFGFIGHWCGGVLIDEFWVISAAHCLQNEMFDLSELPAVWTALIGEYNRDEEAGFEQRISVEKIFIHKQYHNFKNDIAMLKLSKSAIISLESQVAKICLPSHYSTFKGNIDFDYNNNHLKRSIQRVLPNENITKSARQYIEKILKGSKSLRHSDFRKNDKFSQSFAVNTHNKKNDSYFECVVTGWGVDAANGVLSNILHQTKVPIHENDVCKKVYDSYLKLEESHICAGNLNKDLGGMGGTCFGDSGGPLTCRKTNTSPWILVGITSFGLGCDMAGPDVYSDCRYFLPWILQIMRSN